MREKIREFFEEHLAFILAFLITYIIGVLIITIVFLIDLEKNEYAAYDVLKIYLEFITPTTFAYSLTNGITNLVQITNKRKAVWNWFTIVLSVVYGFLFIIYQLKWSNLAMVIVMFICTVVIIFLNFFGYKEYHYCLNRNHGISANSY